MAVTNERLKNYLNEDNLAFLKNYIDAVIRAANNLAKKNPGLAQTVKDNTNDLILGIRSYLKKKKNSQKNDEAAPGYLLLNKDYFEVFNEEVKKYNNFITTLPEFSPEEKRLQIALSVLCVALLVTGITLLVISYPPLALVAADFIKMGWAFLAGGVIDSGMFGYTFFSKRKEEGLRSELSKEMKELSGKAMEFVITIGPTNSDKTKLGSGTEVDAPSDPSPDEFVASPSVG